MLWIVTAYGKVANEHCDCHFLLFSLLNEASEKIGSKSTYCLQASDGLVAYISSLKFFTNHKWVIFVTIKKVILLNLLEALLIPCICARTFSLKTK